eukprot:TRINITY_DN4607_c0_g1_i1.p1 TRINITY_DN4607_c0_g1~~TRINITY_DN4607_c0_g1_i1.p1  ORF type:complete len:898 (+),score=160.38 TRINITY_DN4607_c0_g1_i1:69-2762(+)
MGPSSAVAPLAALLLPSLSSAAASSAAVVHDGPWRFTAETDRLIRVEYDETKQFIDEPTDAFVRSQPLGTWKSSEPAVDGNKMSVLETAGVSVLYKREAAPADGTVEVVSKADPKVRYVWGTDPEPGNLRGTARTLDNEAVSLDLNCHNKVSPTMDNSQMHCQWGLVSRNGWAVVNQTGMPVLKDNWWVSSKNSVDVFVFMHGHDYAGAMKDFTHAAGPAALPPRYALGTMFTRWFDFDSDLVAETVQDFKSRSIPLDAWIFDMNWHIFGPWGSFSWNENSFPQLQNMLDSLQSKGLHVGANFHEHDGISPQEKTYLEFCKALGRVPDNKSIPFDLYNRSYAMAQEDIAFGAIASKAEKQGIDFAWIDYQQGEDDHFENTQIPNLNPTIALNRLRSSFQSRHGQNVRSLILSRWGGLGNHRYPLGFSGDQHHSWEGLEYLPYFTSTAANVAYGYWSHDTVGGDHDLAQDYELTTRWVQVSAWSPVLRFHDKGAGTGDCATGDVCAKILPWDLPANYFQAVREASQKRDELLPYIYTAAFNAVKTGQTLCRPVYYENPEEDALYDDAVLHTEYLFGPDMIVSPITKQSSQDAVGFAKALGAVQWSMYAPAGSRKWFDRLNGNFVSGEKTTGVYGIMDVPRLEREGAIIPLRPRGEDESTLGRAKEVLSSIEFRVSPAEAFYNGGKFSAAASVVDDDGLSTDYERGMFSNTTCSYEFDGQKFSIDLGEQGTFEGKPAHTLVKLSFLQMPPMRFVSGITPKHVEYSHELLGPVFTFEAVQLSGKPHLVLEVDDAYSRTALQNFVGAIGRVRRARYVKNALDDLNVNYGDSRKQITAQVLAATHMSPQFAESMAELWKDAVQEVQALLNSEKVLLNDNRRKNLVAEMMQTSVSKPMLDLVI